MPRAPRTDYATIAPQYDASPFRRENPPDPELEALLGKRPVRVLDVACGTGSFLASQAAAFGKRIAVTGIDRSPDMLEKAREKLPKATLLEGEASKLPFADRPFAFVSCRFAFHHFERKPRALAEIARVLAPGGTFVLANIVPEHMPEWWIYRFFPGTAAIDEARFWRLSRIAENLEKRGLSVTVDVAVTRRRMERATLVREAERRDASELAVLPDAAFRRGLARLRASKETTLATDWAIGRLVAKKPEIQRGSKVSSSQRMGPL